MPPRTLNSPLTCYRIGDADGRYDVWSAGAAQHLSGRWHEAGDRVIYAAEFYSTALLEKLVRTAELPSNQHYAMTTVPAGVSYEVFQRENHPDWASSEMVASRTFGYRWVNEQRSALLIVPSAVARFDRNFVFNTAHLDYLKVKVDPETPVPWDGRLFQDG